MYRRNMAVSARRLLMKITLNLLSTILIAKSILAKQSKHQSILPGLLRQDQLMLPTMTLLVAPKGSRKPRSLRPRMHRQQKSLVSYIPIL